MILEYGDNDNDTSGDDDDGARYGDKGAPQQSWMINSGGYPEGLPEPSMIFTATMMNTYDRNGNILGQVIKVWVPLS